MSNSLRVAEIINELSQRPFTWGRLDCCHFANEVAKAITGVDFSSGFHYSTEREAVQIVNGHDGLKGFVDALLRVESIGASLTQDGDPVLADLETGPTIGVRLQDRVVCKTQRGVGWLPVLAPEVLCGWSLEQACRQR